MKAIIVRHIQGTPCVVVYIYTTVDAAAVCIQQQLTSPSLHYQPTNYTNNSMTSLSLTTAVLLGPIRAITYFFMHGLLAVSLGTLWHWRAHWGITLVTGSITRLLGTLGYFFVTSWTLNEDLFSLLLANVYSLLVSHPLTGPHFTSTVILSYQVLALHGCMNCTNDCTYSDDILRPCLLC